MTGSYPTLGFDPAPGTVSDVDALVRGLTSERDTLGEASSLLHNLNSSTDSSWRGEAADKFRDKVSEDVPKALSKAHDSFEKAASALASWSTELTEYQRQARALEQEAVTAKQKVDAAESHLASVKANPYRVEGESTPQLEQEAKTKQARAESAAGQDVSTARSALDDVIKRAKTLQSTHDKSASETAGKVKSAPDHLAPEEPGLFDRIGSWISDHAGDIGDILSDISAVTGFLALVTPPPFDAAFLAVSVISSLGALGFHAASGASGWTLAGDVLGAVPGIGILGDAAKGARAAETVKDGVTMARQASTMADRAFGAGYAATAATDTARAVPAAVRTSVEEAKVFGSNMSRGVVNGLNKIPGVTIQDGLSAAVNIDRGLAGTGAVLSTSDAWSKTTGLPGVPEPVSQIGGKVLTVVGVGGVGVGKAPTINVP